MRDGKSTDRIKKRITSQIDVIRRNHILENKKLIIFGCTMWLKTLIDYLYKWNYPVSAIIDNNPEKAGGKCLGIDVYLPGEYLEGAQDDVCILICSSYYVEMSKQLEEMGYHEKVDFYIIHFLEQKPSLTRCCMNVILGYILYKRYIKILGDEDAWIFICPYGGSGDIYMAGIFFESFLEKERIDKYIVLVDGALALKTADMMNMRPVYQISEQQKLLLLNAWSFLGDEIMHVKPLLYWGWRVKRFPNPDAKMDITFLDVMKYDVYQLPQDVNPRIPDFSGTDFAADYFAQKNLVKGKTVILSPYAGSFKTDISIEIWEKIADKLIEKGYCVCTNSASDKEPVLRGTIPVFFPLKNLVEILDYAGYFIGIRSGLCDIASSTKCKFIVLYERALNAIKYEFFSFEKMGLNLHAAEFIYDSENAHQFVEDIIEQFS